MKKLFGILTLLFVAAFSLIAEAGRFPRAAAPTSGFNGGGIQINRFVASYYNGMNRWINIWNQGDTVCIVSSLNGTLCGAAAWNALGASGQSYFNSTTGELNIPVQTDVTSYGRGVFTSPAGSAGAVPNAIYGPTGGAGGAQGKWWLGLVMNLEWTGTISTAGTKITNSGTFGTGGTTGFGAINGCGTNCVTATYGSTSGTNGAGEANNLAIFFVIDASNRSDPPRLIKFYPASMVTQARSADVATSLINPTWLSQWGVVGKVRWMEENGEVNINGMTDYSQLADYTFNTFAANASFYAPAAQTYLPGTNKDYGPKGGIGALTICALSNKTGQHAHYTIPWGANSTFSTQLATAFDGCMNQGLIVDYEYCNETWNFGAAFQCFYYLNRQAWPPLGVSAPYQQALTISSITTGGVNTTINGTNTYTDGQVVAFDISTSDTISTVLNSGWFIVANRTGSSFTVTANTTGLSYSSGGTAYIAGSASTRAGYNAAKQLQQVRDAYGSSKRARWKGVLGGQLSAADGAPLSTITGAMFYVLNESTGSGSCSPNLCLSDLFNYLAIAPYSGNPSYNGQTITNITQNTASGSTVVTASGHNYVNGQTLRIYAKTGMTQIDNATVTVSAANIGAGTFNINVNTTGYSAWATAAGNFSIDNALPKAADDSISLNGSSPGTYPTRYSYFAEQMTDAILNGTSVSNPSFGYVVDAGGNYRSYASCGLTCIPGIMLDNASLANSYGLLLTEYEAAIFATYIDTNGGGHITSGGASSNQLWDFFYNWQYDAGTATHGPADIATAHIAASQAAGVDYPSLFNEEGSGPGPFNATRYFGDTPSSIGPMLTRNALGPYTLPRPSPTWTVSNTYPTAAANRLFTSAGCSSCTDSFTPTLGTAATQVFLLASATGTDYPTSAACDGVTLTAVQQSNVASGIAVIYTGTLAAGTSTRNCSATYTGATQNFQFREYYAFTVTGLTSTTETAKFAASTQFGQVAFTAGSDSLIIMIATRPTVTGYMTGTTTPIAANPTTTTVAADFDGSVHTAGYSLFRPTFGSPIFKIGASTGSTGAMAVAVYH
jgi:hypothetical protein